MNGSNTTVKCSNCGESLPFAFGEQRGDIVCMECRRTTVAESDDIDINPGDRMVDHNALRDYQLDPDAEDQSTPSIAVVLGKVADRADAHRPPDTGKTIAQFNPDFPPDDRVFRVGFIGGRNGLDQRVGPKTWREWPADQLIARLADLKARHNTWPKTYDYPGLRLVPVNDHVGERDIQLSREVALSLP